MSEGLPVEVTCRVVGVSAAGFSAWRTRKPSPQAVRHAIVADVILQVHDESRQTFGARRAHAELVLGRKLTVARCTVELMMRRLGLAGLPGRPRYRKVPNTATASDLVTVTPPAPNRTVSGSPTSPNTRPVRARCTARSCSTCSRGKELSAHAALTVETGIPVFFADPHSPGQRGTNENTNGLVRQYFPKGTDLARWNATDLTAVAAALNSLPRKTLGWRTPAEALDEHLRSLQQGSVASID